MKKFYKKLFYDNFFTMIEVSPCNKRVNHYKEIAAEVIFNRQEITHDASEVKKEAVVI
jgi:hypothetical protein